MFEWHHKRWGWPTPSSCFFAGWYTVCWSALNRNADAFQSLSRFSASCVHRHVSSSVCLFQKALPNRVRLESFGPLSSGCWGGSNKQEKFGVLFFRNKKNFCLVLCKSGISRCDQWSAEQSNRSRTLWMSTKQRTHPWFCYSINIFVPPNLYWLLHCSSKYVLTPIIIHNAPTWVP